MHTNPRVARQVSGLLAYAAADKSDPFTFARGMAHINSGICNPGSENKDSSDPIYTAELYQEEREYTFNGSTVKYTAPAYKSMKRP